MIKKESHPAKNIEGIICFNPDIKDDYENYHVTGLEKIQAAEKFHFWFITRRERIINEIKKYLAKSSRILELGAGTGFIANGLQDEGYNVAIGDVHLSGLKYARENGIRKCYQFDLFEPPFSNEFDAVCMFDVIEHFPDDISALCNVSKILNSNGRLFITVPAHQCLWSRDDKIAAHKRRYSKRLLINNVEQAGFQVDSISYIFIAILPLLYIRHLFNRDNQNEISDHERNQGFQINFIINKILLLLTMIENKFSKWLPDIAGGSLLLVAIKS